MKTNHSLIVGVHSDWTWRIGYAEEGGSRVWTFLCFFFAYHVETVDG